MILIQAIEEDLGRLFSTIGLAQPQKSVPAAAPAKGAATQEPAGQSNGMASIKAEKKERVDAEKLAQRIQDQNFEIDKNFAQYRWE